MPFRLVEGQRVAPLDTVHVALPLGNVRGSARAKSKGDSSIATGVVNIVSRGVSGGAIVIGEAKCGIDI